jgi:hypothetical protein
MAKKGNRRGGTIAKAISDRSGFRFPMSEMVIEEGTGWLVHKSEDDGMWNLVDHPLNHVQRYVEFGDPFPVDNARPEQVFESREWLEDFDGKPLDDIDGSNLETRDVQEEKRKY